MDHAERVAQRLFESAIPGSRMDYRASQSKGEYDFDLHCADGGVSAVEVTSSVDQALEETHDAIIAKDKGGSSIPTRLCKNSWYIHLLSDTRINPLRKKADLYLAAIENAGIEKFWGPTDDRPAVEAIYQDLGVISGSVASWVRAGNILMALPGSGGAVGVSTVFEAAEREAFKTDNRKKLGAAGTPERHLAIYVYMTTLAWVPLSDFEPIPVAPNLPPEITGIWIFSESSKGGEYVIWRAGPTVPWAKRKLVLDI
jgi:hypothetical protein